MRIPKTSAALGAMAEVCKSKIEPECLEFCVCVCDRRVVQQSLERHGETAFGPDLQNGSYCSSLVWRVYGLSHVVYMVLVHTLVLPP